jgi:hypothetical protein
VAEDEYGGPVAGEAVGGVPQLHPQDRVQADRRLVEHQQPGLAEQRDGQGHPGPLAAGQGAHDTVALLLEGDGPIHSVARAAVTPRILAKNRRFSATVRSSYTLGCWVTQPIWFPQRGRPGG